MKHVEKAMLEDLLDKYGTADLLHALNDICWEKAEHVRTNWNDENLARDWETAAKTYYDAATTINLLP